MRPHAGDRRNKLLLMTPFLLLACVVLRHHPYLPVWPYLSSIRMHACMWVFTIQQMCWVLLSSLSGLCYLASGCDSPTDRHFNFPPRPAHMPAIGAAALRYHTLRSLQCSSSRTPRRQRQDGFPEPELEMHPVHHLLSSPARHFSRGHGRPVSQGLGVGGWGV